MSNLHKLHGLGQSVWLDFIRRSHTRSGELARLVAAGVESFAQSFTSLLASLEQKRRSLGV